MDIVSEQKQISVNEKVQINSKVKEDLVYHLYEGCLPGTISGMIASIVLFIDYYHYTPTNLLIIWIVAFNIMMISLTGLYFCFIKYKNKFNLTTWEWAYSIMMIGCAIAWVPAILLMPETHTRQYLALIALFLATTGYATGTIGQFKLCMVTLNIILIPLIIWCLIKGGIFYNILAIYSIIYMVFMCSINYRSTTWFKDSLKLKLENTLVSYQANHDLLTNLPNQRLLPQFIDSAINYANEHHCEFAVVSFSLNRLEIINDSLGHEASNLIIQSVANRLNQIKNQQESASDIQYFFTISRKDSFNVIVIPLSPLTAKEKLSLLFSSLDDPFFLEQNSIRITACIGVSFFPKDGKDAISLIKNADAAMLQGKQFGGNRLEFYREEINAQVPERLELENDLHIALKEHQFVVYYQPLIDLLSGKIIGSEALIRWNHPQYGFIPPVQFIPLAEETGLIIPIGEWVLREACKQTKSWHEMGFKRLSISVNLAAKQLRQENILNMIEQILETTHFDARFLELELTETAILDESVIPLIQQFKQIGLSLAVDDFGTGYSGLSYLKRFAIDKLKIDQSFIRDIPTNNDSITIVSAILAMAKELKVASLAEGIETVEQLEFLKSKGCDYGQGYYFSKPIDAKSFMQLLQKQANAQLTE